MSLETIPAQRHSLDRRTFMIVAGGWARSGKGTSMGHLKHRIEAAGKRVRLIDQGRKFRAMGDVAIGAGQPLDSPTVLNDFLRSPQAQKTTLAVLAEMATMSEADIKARFYTPEISTASRKVGAVPGSHQIAIGLLRAEVTEAVEDKTDVALIDGRSMDKYAREFDRKGLARFVMGWHFTCDPVIAARRSLGIGPEVNLEDLPPDNQKRLLAEAVSISDRNRADTLRTVDPLHEPAHAYRLDLSTYGDPDLGTPYRRGHDALRMGMVMVDTSYTSSIEQMTDPVAELSMFALLFKSAIPHEAVGIKVA